MSILATDFSEAAARLATKKKEAVRRIARLKKAHATFDAADKAMSRKKVVVRTPIFSGGSLPFICAVSEEPIQALQTTRLSGAVFRARPLRSTFIRSSKEPACARQRVSDL